MAEQYFSLIPFPDPTLPRIKITGNIVRQANTLSIHYSLTGDIENILFPEPCIDPSRKDELWTATCFEFFVAIPGEPAYWEFNMSPSGNWNVYRMDGYRRVGFREETLIQRLPFSVHQEPGRVSVEAAVVLSPIIQAETPIQVAITSVIQTKEGNESYWALAHPNPQPDFHLRESFTLDF
jgi:hypothetical protein